MSKDLYGFLRFVLGFLKEIDGIPRFFLRFFVRKLKDFLLQSFLTKKPPQAMKSRDNRRNIGG